MIYDGERSPRVHYLPKKHIAPLLRVSTFITFNTQQSLANADGERCLIGRHPFFNITPENPQVTEGIDVHTGETERKAYEGVEQQGI